MNSWAYEDFNDAFTKSFCFIITGQRENLDELKTTTSTGAILSTTVLPRKCLMNFQQREQMPNFLIDIFCINIKIYDYFI